MNAWRFFSDRLRDDDGGRMGIQEAFQDSAPPEFSFAISGDEATIYKRGWTYGRIKTLNGMCGVMLLYDIRYSMSKEDMTVFKSLANWGGYTKIMATNVIGGNAQKALVDHGFKLVDSFRNKRTGNEVGVFMCELQ